MKNRKNGLEVAYKFLEAQKKSNFNNILNHVRKELEIDVDSEQDKKLIGNLYLGMISDNNFFVKDGIWYPRSQVTLEEIKLSQANIIIDDTNDDLDFSEDNLDETVSFLEDEDDDKIHIAEDNYGDGDEEDLDLNKRILQEEFQGG